MAWRRLPNRHPAWVVGLAAGVCVVGIGAGLFALSLHDGDPGLPAGAADTATAASGNNTTTPAATPTTAPTATPSASAVSTATAVAVTGLFDTPRDLPVASRELAPPGREFPREGLQPTFEWDGRSTMIYDRQTGTLLNLGPGEPAAFSPSGEWAAWVSEDRFTGTVHALNLKTGERKNYDWRGYVSFFVDEHRVLVDDQESNGWLVDVLTGERDAVEDRPALFAATLADVLQVSRPDQTRPHLLRVSDLKETRALEFEALSALPFDANKLLVETVPQNGQSNVFVVDFATGSATFIATAPTSELGLALSGNGTHVAWSNVCADPGESWVLDRRTGQITHVPKGLFVSPASRAPDGLLGTGLTGLERLIDPVTMRYLFISPAGWPSWSRDLRYVSVGWVGGHGGICGP